MPVNETRETAPLLRRIVHFSGCVQGVGFRQTTVDIAQGFNVAGVVRNLADGRVELVVEGDASEITRFQEAIVARMKSNIGNVEATESPAAGQFKGFRIAW